MYKLATSQQDNRIDCGLSLLFHTLINNYYSVQIPIAHGQRIGVGNAEQHLTEEEIISSLLVRQTVQPEENVPSY